MRLTVLGKSPSWQDAGGACSGYLIEDGTSTVLLDCGNGVFSKLRRFRDYTTVDAVLISHLHADRWPGTSAPAHPRLIAPPGARDTFRRVVGAWGNEDLIENAFDIQEYEESTIPEVGSLRFSFRTVPHFQETYAIRVASSNGSGGFVFGADCRPTAELIDFAQGADLLLIEATLPRPERSGERGHLTPREAGEHGRDSGAKHLVLTHISDELDHLWARKEAMSVFDGPVDIAAEGAVYSL